MLMAMQNKTHFDLHNCISLVKALNNTIKRIFNSIKVHERCTAKFSQVIRVIHPKLSIKDINVKMDYGLTIDDL